MHRSSRPLRAIQAALFLLLAGCVDGGGTFVPVATVLASRPMPPAARALRLETRVGGIRVTSASGGEIKIEAIVKANPSKVEIEKASKAFEAHVRVAEEGEVLRIEDAHKDAADREAWQVELRVSVPRAVAVEAATGVGDVDIGVAAGDVRGRSGVGNVRLSARDIGSLRLDTGVGEVTAETARVAGDVRAKVGTGNVALTLGGAGGSTEAEAGTGSVKVAFASAPKKDVTASAGIGHAKISLPADARGKFSGRAGVGSVRVTGFDGVTVKKTFVGGSISGTTGEGPTYEVKAGTGDITIEAR